MPPERSRSGRWVLGEQVQMMMGVCKGHELHVVNPDTVYHLMGTPVEAVLLRCDSCFRSYYVNPDYGTKGAADG